MKRFESDMPKAIPFKSATEETPHINLMAYPEVRGILAGLVTFILVGLIAIGAEWSVNVPLICAGLVGLVVYGVFLLVTPPVHYTTRKIKGHKPPAPPELQQAQSPSLAITYHRSERHKRLDELPGPPEVIIAWAEVFIRGGSVAYKAWEAQFGYRIDENDKEVSLYREFRKRITSGDKPLAKEHGKHGIKPTRYGFEEFSDLVRVGLDNATPLLGVGEALATQNDRWEPPAHTDTPAGEGDHHV